MERLVGTLREKQALAKLVGIAPAFEEAIKNLPAIAKSDANILITGDTGTGKELVARAAYYLSNRAAYPFVPLNCGSFPEALMEVELFGHERGAFTDVQIHRKGLLAQAEGGTLFLDKVNTLPIKGASGSAALLAGSGYRVVGSSEESRANVRILSASNAPLFPTEPRAAAGAPGTLQDVQKARDRGNADAAKKNPLTAVRSHLRSRPIKRKLQPQAQLPRRERCFGCRCGAIGWGKEMKSASTTRGGAE
jgi:sigma-54 interacting transcriptional regulator